MEACKRSVESRLMEFTNLKDDWLEGCGSAFDVDNLIKLAYAFRQYYPREMELPYIYPDEGKCLVFEWEDDVHSISLHVSTDSFRGEWYDYNIATDDITELHFHDLLEEETWREIIEMLLDRHLFCSN